MAAETMRPSLRVVLLADRETVHNAFFESKVRAMEIRYFVDTDTLHIEFRALEVVETRDIDENTTLDVDAKGDMCSITVEHASERAGIPEISYEQVAA